MNARGPDKHSQPKAADTTYLFEQNYTDFTHSPGHDFSFGTRVAVAGFWNPDT